MSLTTETSNAIATAAVVKQPRILIVSWLRWVAGPRLAAALGDLGAEVHTLCTSFHPMRAVEGIGSRGTYSMFDPVGSIRAAIRRVRPDIIVSCDDETTNRLYRLLVEAEAGARPDDDFIVQCIERSFGSTGAFAVCTARAPLIAAAAAAGVRTPHTSSIESWSELSAWAEIHGLPAFLKADGTHGGNGVIEIRSLDEARRAWKRLASPPSPIEAIKYLIKQQDLSRLGALITRRRATVSVQAAVQGRAANCLAVCRDGELLAYIGVEVGATAKPTGFGTVIRYSDNDDMRHAAEAIARKLRLNGVFGLDFIIKDGTDEAYLIEMNPRLTPLAHFHFGHKHDPAAALCALVTNDLDRREREGGPPREAIAVFPHMLARGGLVSGSPLLVDAPWAQPELLRLSMPLPSNPIELFSELISRFLL